MLRLSGGKKEGERAREGEGAKEILSLLNV
jgi:hypothetical protein